MEFVFSGIPTRVVFGPGQLAQVRDEAQRLGMKRPLVITGKQQAELGRQVKQIVGGTCFDGAAMHTPVSVTDMAMAFAAAEMTDGTIAIGGGSAIGLGKAIALRTDCAQIAIPTTYAGSEMTNILGETAGGRKTTKRDVKIQPETVIYDPDLTATLPLSLSATSGLNAIAHAVEALYAKDGNPVVSLMAEDGIRALASALPSIETARESALYGAWLCGTVLGQVSMALHHKLCHVLGGTFNLPHAETHAVILPYATAYNAPAAPAAMARIAKALGSSGAATGLYDLARRLKVPASLSDLGFKHGSIVQAVEEALANPYWNPREITRDGLFGLLSDAFSGKRPEA